MFKKYKKIYLLSLGIVFFSALILPQTGRGFGLPFSWLIYTGENEITLGFELLLYKHFRYTQFDVGSFLISFLIISLGLIIIYKVFNKVFNKS